MLFLVDKSALVRVEHSPVAEDAFLSLDEVGTLATCDVIDLEVGYSARSAAEYERMWAARGKAYVSLPLTAAIFARARNVQRLLVKRGQHRGAGIADLLTAACAEVHRATVVHYDTDYDAIAAVTGQAMRWLVPRGTVN